MIQKWMTLLMMREKIRMKYLSTSERYLGMIETNTKMKVIMPCVTWRVVGENSRKKKQGVYD